MFDLEQKILEWRQHLQAAGLKTPAALDELESHLRDDMHDQLAQGISESSAFNQAVARLGCPGAMQTEFKKLGWPQTPVLVGVAIWAAAVITFKILFVRSLGRSDPLLLVHIYIFSTGYCTAFLAGGFGIYQVLRQRFSPLPPEQRSALDGAVLWASRLAAGLSVVGYILGMLWVRQHVGGYWVVGPRQILGSVTCLWLVASWVFLEAGRLSHRGVVLLSIVGNLMVGLPWFGVFFYSIPRQYEFYNWQLAFVIFLGLHLWFLVLGMFRQREAAQA